MTIPIVPYLTKYELNVLLLSCFILKKEQSDAKSIICAAIFPFKVITSVYALYVKEVQTFPVNIDLMYAS